MNSTDVEAAGRHRASVPINELRLAAAAFAIVALGYFAIHPLRDPNTDFLHFYAGARLVGPDLYSLEKTRAIQEEISPGVLTLKNPVRAVVRPPFLYLLFQPLGSLPYERAVWIWQALNVSALALFVFLWPADRLMIAACFGLFVPLWYGLYQAQDFGLFLLAFAASAWLKRANWQIVAGAILSLCAGKPNVFLLLPITLLAARSWRFGIGFIGGGLLLYGLSAMILGGDFGWPASYLAHLASVYSIFTGNRSGIVLAVVLGAILGVFLARRRAAFPAAIAVLLAGSLIAAQRPSFYDAAALVPLTLVLMQARRVVIPVAAICLLTVAWHLFGWVVARPVAVAFLAYAVWVDHSSAEVFGG
jgi:hypothetical protein